MIRDEAVAQAYLVSLLGTKERRTNVQELPKARIESKKKRPDPETPPTVQGQSSDSATDS
jgi:hypothetical protein